MRRSHAATPRSGPRLSGMASTDPFNPLSGQLIGKRALKGSVGLHMAAAGWPPKWTRMWSGATRMWSGAIAWKKGTETARREAHQSTNNPAPDGTGLVTRGECCTSGAEYAGLQMTMRLILLLSQSQCHFWLRLHGA
jgi:hypothetical protein